MIIEYVNKQNSKTKKEAIILGFIFFSITIMWLYPLAASPVSDSRDLILYFWIAIYFGLGGWALKMSNYLPELSNMKLGDKILYKNGFIFNESAKDQFLIEKFDSQTLTVLLKNLSSQEYKEVSIKNLSKEYIKV